MRVLYAWDADYPWDVRTEKICLTLVQHGHEVTIAARNLQARPLCESLPEGLVERLAPGPAFGRHLRSFPVPFNPWWLAHIRRLIRKHDTHLVIVRDLPLAPTVLAAAAGRIPVVLDMAENYPAMMQDIRSDGRQRPLDILVRNPAAAAWVERLVLPRVHHTITVVEESSERLVRLGVPRKRLSVVSNTPPFSRVSTLSPRLPGEPLRLVYLGLMEKHRGVLTILDAAAQLVLRQVPFHLDLVGDGRDDAVFRSHARQLNLPTDVVTFHGRLPHQAAIALVAKAHVGLVPHHARESWNTTIPNKLFDYMAAGLAVITSDAVPAARVVRETAAGLVFESGAAAGLAQAIEACADPAVLEPFRRAGQAAIRDRYNWEADTDVLLKVVAAFEPPAARALATSGRAG